MKVKILINEAQDTIKICEINNTEIKQQGEDNIIIQEANSYKYKFVQSNNMSQNGYANCTKCKIPTCYCTMNIPCMPSKRKDKRYGYFKEI